MRFLKQIRVPSQFTIDKWLKHKGYQINTDYSLLEIYSWKGKAAELWTLSLAQANNQMVTYPLLLVHPYLYVLEWREGEKEKINIKTVSMNIRRYRERQGLS